MLLRLLRQHCGGDGELRWPLLQMQTPMTTQ
jgi:hypothetical protein